MRVISFSSSNVCSRLIYGGGEDVFWIGGSPCRISIIRNDNVALSNLRKPHVALSNKKINYVALSNLTKPHVTMSNFRTPHVAMPI